MKFNTALILATAGSLVAAQEPHRHGHRHLHRRDAAATAVSTEVVYVYQLDGENLSADEVCQGVKDGKYLWADGTAPAGACAAASSTAAASSSTSVAAAEFFEVSSSSSSPTPSSSSSSTFTSSSTIVLTSSTSTSSAYSTSTSSSSSTAWTTSSATSSSTSSSASASSTSTTTTSGGGVTIKNTVGRTIYLWTTSETAGEMVTVANGETYSENWLLNPDEGGISIKISTTTSKDDVLQFEYTLIKPTIWWDVSLINLETSSLFDKVGFSVTSDNSDCYTVNCPAGETACSDAYLWPTDDQATHSCTSGTNMVLNLGAPL